MVLQLTVFWYIGAVLGHVCLGLGVLALVTMLLSWVFFFPQWGLGVCVVLWSAGCKSIQFLVHSTQHNATQRNTINHTTPHHTKPHHTTPQRHNDTLLNPLRQPPGPDHSKSGPPSPLPAVIRSTLATAGLDLKTPRYTCCTPAGARPAPCQPG